MKKIIDNNRLIVLSCILLLAACKPEELAKVTKLNTGEIIQKSYNSATVSGEIIDLSGNVTSYGHCWNSSGNPTVADEKYTVSSTVKKGSFSSYLTNLSANTKYYVKAYAIDGEKEIYGEILEFTTLAIEPTITTTDANKLTYTNAKLNGTINANGGEADVSFQWGLTSSYGNSVNASPSTANGNSAIPISADISGLTPGTTYHYRIVADNHQEIFYGEDNTFTTIPTNVTDLDGNIYNTVIIGEQIWLKENLIVRRYQNGDFIGTLNPFYLDISTEDMPKYQWYYKDVLPEMLTYFKQLLDAGLGAYTLVELSDLGIITPVQRDQLLQYISYVGIENGNTKTLQAIVDEANSISESYENAYGLYYTWYAVNDSRGICPAGWHVPTDTEWKVLELYLGMSITQVDLSGMRGTNQGDQIKEAGTSHWISPNTGTNSSGFSALPSGYRYAHGQYLGYKYNAKFWTNSEDDADRAWSRELYSSSGKINRERTSKKDAFSVRCLKD